jgi:L-threonylcarbamoyladenylate synthase
MGDPSPAIEVRSLSASGDVVEAARNLFRMLRQLDDHPATTLLIAEPVQSTHGLSHAIADRLARAAAAKFSSSHAVKHTPSV